ncbi:5-formyltetrahydrofolate cyclo-ligase family protein [Candidatus Gugararchaeum adminiculabundum]|nr:5-formyltetrahydrofolate cyclo-ligase family protein [Candidatus Gugararchaeum adminiculabundum]
MEIAKEKGEAREKVWQVNSSHMASEKTEKSRLILERVVALNEYAKAKKIFAYVSREDEAGTRELIVRMLKEGKQVFVPKIYEKEMVAVRIGSLEELKEGKFKVLQPTNAKETSEEFDLIFIVGVGFDAKRNRIGGGFGYFDKFLVKVKGKKVALAFDWQVVDKVPTEKHDVRMDKIITDKRVIE